MNAIYCYNISTIWYCKENCRPTMLTQFHPTLQSLMQAMVRALRDELGKVHDELVKTKEDFSYRESHLFEEVEKLLELEAVRDWEKAREHLACEELKLGKLVVQDGGCMPVQGSGVNRNNMESQFKEVWQEGRRAKELQQSQAELLQRKIALDGRRKLLHTALLYLSPSCWYIESLMIVLHFGLLFFSVGKAAIKALRVAQSGTLAELEALQEEEVTRAHGVVLKKEEMALVEDKRVLEVLCVLPAKLFLMIAFAFDALLHTIFIIISSTSSSSSSSSGV